MTQTRRTLRGKAARRLILGRSRNAGRRLRSAAARLERFPAARPALVELALRIESAGKRITTRLGSAEVQPECRERVTRTLGRLVNVQEPIILISQAPRSGGTLLLRLFDGHSECHAVPYEFGDPFPPRPHVLGGARQAWKVLADGKAEERYRRGYRQPKSRLHGDADEYPVDLPPALQRALFERLLATPGNPDEPAVLRAYFTSYFSAWLDYANLPGSKRWVVIFEPGALARPRARSRFAEMYPEGRLLSIVRDPWSWYQSASLWSARWSNRTLAIDGWRRNVEAALAWHADEPGAVRLVSFDGLVRQTERTMRALADFLDIGFESTLLTPTFNGRPIAANSSFRGAGDAISVEPLTRGASLDPGDREYIAQRAGEVYKAALCVAVADAPVHA